MHTYTRMLTNSSCMPIPVIVFRTSDHRFASTPDERDQWVAAVTKSAHVYNIDDFYQIGAKLGAGKFSTVHLGTHKITGKKYAIKVIDKTEMDQKEREALRAEIAVLKLVKHPNVIHLKNQFETRKFTYIVMGLCACSFFFVCVCVCVCA
jgi:serine/threonine protein kinase